MKVMAAERRIRKAPAVLAALLAQVPLLFFLWPADLATGQPAQAADRSHPGFKISVDVSLVVLHASVRDHRGGFVSALQSENFKVYEDGVPQEIKLFAHEDAPVTVGLIIDNSGSMRPKRGDVMSSALAFARSSNPRDEMFLVHFNERAWLGLPPAVMFTGDHGLLEAALTRGVPGGRTAIYDAIALGLEHLERAHFDKKALVVISDGGDNASRRSWPEVRTMAQASDAIVYTVGLADEEDPDWNPAVLKRLAQETGGEAFLPREMRAVTGICEQIARDVRNQYTIGYVPSSGRRSGGYHTIRATASSPGQSKLSVRTRAGYLAAPVPVPAKTGDALR
jgi:Ca-activated chloride channel homolog